MASIASRATPGCLAVASNGLGSAFLGKWRLSMSKIRPLQDRVIIRRLKEEEKSKGGIIIPDTAKEKPAEGEVMAVGSGKILENGTVRKLDVPWATECSSESTTGPRSRSTARTA